MPKTVGIVLLSFAVTFAGKTAQTSYLTASEKFCQTLANNCPYLRSATARPFLEGRSIEVTVNFWPTAFLGINDLEQRFSLQANFRLYWQLPPCARWSRDSDNCAEQDPSPKCDKSLTCLYNLSSIWHPVMEHLNRIGDQSSFKRGSEYVSVTSDGTAMWQVSGRFDSSCSLSFQSFPFDKQNCTVKIGMPHVWDQVVVSFDKMSKLESMEAVFTVSDVWRLERHSVYVVNDDVTFMPIIAYVFSLRRRARSYLGSIFVPMAILAIIQLGIFIMPPVMAERCGLSMTSFLASLIVIGLICQNLPKTPEFMYLVFLLAAEMLISALITIYTLMACRLLANNEKTYNRCIANFFDLVVFLLALALYGTASWLFWQRVSA